MFSFEICWQSTFNGWLLYFLYTVFFLSSIVTISLLLFIQSISLTEGLWYYNTMDQSMLARFHPVRSDFTAYVNWERDLIDYLERGHVLAMYNNTASRLQLIHLPLRKHTYNLRNTHRLGVEWSWISRDCYTYLCLNTTG